MIDAYEKDRRLAEWESTCSGMGCHWKPQSRKRMANTSNKLQH
ncbi:hypothetical protein M2401_003689 [Pseudomonas sp. JUb42]|nr:hypothetical protein [Pseudomonas sp. JUb42]